jgi:hypothetical protein
MKRERMCVCVCARVAPCTTLLSQMLVQLFVCTLKHVSWHSFVLIPSRHGHEEDC